MLQWALLRFQKAQELSVGLGIDNSVSFLSTVLIDHKQHFLKDTAPYWTFFSFPPKLKSHSHDWAIQQVQLFPSRLSRLSPLSLTFHLS